MWASMTIFHEISVDNEQIQKSRDETSLWLSSVPLFFPDQN